MKWHQILGFIMEVLFVLLAIILIIQLVWKLTGHSPTEMQVMYVILGGIISFLFVMSYKMGIFVGEVKEFMKTSKHSFSKIGKELNELKTDVSALKLDVTVLKKDSAKIKTKLKI